ncbi:TetR family transcriptional regulator [Actinoplanes sp. NPDC051633]|uniref:TetR family transcriptional regulator n=1 Tax=Actinoplanes sp. NPDC051633 TaxID=3155670 RepID=UPI003447734C
MARWEGDAAGRLREAAMELYASRGFEQTTVAEIAARAGVTARTFFRHFADKREVLFAGSETLQETMVSALAGATGGPMDAVGAALDACTPFLGRDHAYSRRRQAVISANAELRERELIKMERLSAALAEGLRQRGVPEPDASLAAQAGIGVFHIAFARWVEAETDTGLAAQMRDAFTRMRALAQP